MPFWREPGLVLDFQFAERQGNIVYDLSGNGNHGTVYGAVWRRGPLLGALNFDGIDDYVLAPETLNVSPPVTFEIVYYQRGAHNYERLVSKWELTTYTGWEILLGLLTVNEIAFAYGDGSSRYAHWWYPKTPVRGRWNHYVIIHDGSYVYGYLNLEILPKQPAATSIAGNTRSVYIGAYDVSFYVLDGAIALFRIYNRVLSEREIRSHYNYIFGRINRIRRRLAARVA